MLTGVGTSRTVRHMEATSALKPFNTEAVILFNRRTGTLHTGSTGSAWFSCGAPNHGAGIPATEAQQAQGKPCKKCFA